ncbi:flagellar hook-length control protein FliK [Salinibacillus xinjiangensis]|uniref:Flagellar hook-length control protein-like C-terminal domain-containing protein n=1 Tax=Salinibacillus xinjiangensis TaxID=1229268 RepID=A0A6G1X340_9BACI|nr:flagellar hook-length control protein FliK [Salinibacillus xinjiangensis]MRG85397.1 hypothetical protein [Salinibacillus xinjiangensis]
MEVGLFQFNAIGQSMKLGEGLPSTKKTDIEQAFSTLLATIQGGAMPQVNPDLSAQEEQAPIQKMFEQLEQLLADEDLNQAQVQELTALLSQITAYFKTPDNGGLGLQVMQSNGDKISLQSNQNLELSSLLNMAKTLLQSYEAMTKGSNQQAGREFQAALTKITHLLSKSEQHPSAAKLVNTDSLDVKSSTNTRAFVQQILQSSQGNSRNVSSHVLRSVMQQGTVSQEEKVDSLSLKATNTLTVDSMPMSKTEQYTLYLQRSHGQQSKASESNLLEEMQKVIKSSRFIQNGGSTQLTIKLKPAHLGDMMLSFTQINGETAVKITVTSQVAKEMVESNLTQLRHMFSPQQVVVEKQAEPIIQQQSSSFLANQHQEEQEKQGYQEKQQKQSEQDDYEDVELEKSFEDYLMEI